MVVNGISLMLVAVDAAGFTIAGLGRRFWGPSSSDSTGWFASSSSAAQGASSTSRRMK